MLASWTPVSVKSQDTTYARRIIRDLSAPGMHGRGASYRGDSLAADYIRREFRRLRVKPLGENYYQRYNYNTFSMEGQCWIATSKNHKLKNYDEFRVAPWSTSIVKPNVELLTLPLETFLNPDKLNKFIAKRERELLNCFVYIDASGMSRLDKEEKERCQHELNGLQRRNPFGSKGIMVGLNRLNTCSVGRCDYERGYAYIEVLASAMPKGCKELNVCINTQFRRNYRTQNVCGLIEGEVDTMIVYTAHYDHLGTMGDGYKYMIGNGEIHHEGTVLFAGAHDNASGVAAVLDMARMASHDKPHYTTVFMLFSGEEVGLKGSTYAAEHPLIDYSKVKLLLNIDMFCGGDEGMMVFNAESDNTKTFFNRLKVLNDALQIAPEIRPRKNSPNSDHWPFRNLCPSMFVLTMGQPYGGYHDPADVCEKCGLEHYSNYLTLLSSLAL